MTRKRQEIKKSRIMNIGIIIMSIFMFWSLAHSQKVMTFKAEDGEIFMLPELGAIIVKSDDGPKVEMVIPPDHRPENYRTIDLQMGDIIKMFNGKSMKSVSMCEDMYNEIAIGDDVKLGIKRGNEMLIQKFAKADEKDMPGQMMVKMKTSEDDISTDFIDIGLLLDEKDGKISVADVISEMGFKFQGDQPAEGDELIKIQDNKISSPENLKMLYDKINIGESVSLVFLRDGQEIVSKFVKPEAGEAKPIKIMKKQDN